MAITLRHDDTLSHYYTLFFYDIAGSHGDRLLAAAMWVCVREGWGSRRRRAEVLVFVDRSVHVTHVCQESQKKKNESKMIDPDEP